MGDNLFSEYRLKGQTIKNRIVMPPMVCLGLAAEDGMVTEQHVQHYAARAKGGVGLIIVEATCITSTGRLGKSQLGLWSDDQVEGMSKIAAVGHEHGAKVMVQIHHAGLKAPATVTDDLIAPSNYQENGSVARAVTPIEIRELQAQYVQAARRAKHAGFDGVELHGAHGYLISQFLSPSVNQREDEYGGTLEKRTRFVLEIVTEIRAKIGDNFIIGCRMGGNEPTLADSIEIAKLLEAQGVDILHVSAGMGGRELPIVPPDFNYNWIVYCGTEIKKKVNIPVITVNELRTPERANYLIEKGLADFTAIGRGLLVDPEWANKARSGTAITECLGCSSCFRFGKSELCPQND